MLSGLFLLLNRGLTQFALFFITAPRIKYLSLVGSNLLTVEHKKKSHQTNVIPGDDNDCLRLMVKKGSFIDRKVSSSVALFNTVEICCLFYEVANEEQMMTTKKEGRKRLKVCLILVLYSQFNLG